MAALILQLAACSPASSPSACPPSQCPSGSDGASAVVSAGLPGVPPGFPVMDGAAPVPNPGADAIAAWRIPTLGSAAYDFYTSALPRAGYVVLGAYPSERSALIRFRAPSGMLLQLVAEQSDAGTLIRLRPDRP